MTGSGGKRASEGGKVPAAHAKGRRFYTKVSIREMPEAVASAAYAVELDGRPVRTPAKAILAVPNRALATAVAAEWEAQGERIDPMSMPLTRLVNSAIDGVRGREEEVRRDVAKYAVSDLLCYRATEPQGLVQCQKEAWDPIVAWGEKTLAARFVVTQGIMPVTQSQAVEAAVLHTLHDSDAFVLAALHVMTTLTGSALLAIAHAKGRLDAEAAWAAAHVDEDWQISKWGEDAEASARRARRWEEMQAASRLLALLATG
ncbi:MAG TPA: ATP12 family protein [Hyphomicrobiaceae bacterium]|nr:ATP12 family protein [Hyphomicrobiaceae bacterium]